jgi:hypothetical protein
MKYRNTANLIWKLLEITWNYLQSYELYELWLEVSESVFRGKKSKTGRLKIHQGLCSRDDKKGPNKPVKLLL